MSYTKYRLTATQLQKIANLCVQEQGSINGVKAEASLMANLLETSLSRQSKYGSDGAGLYNYVRNGGWFYRAAFFMDGPKVGKKYVDAVKDVLVEGNRTLPQYVDEHDCFSDIQSISTGGVAGAIRDRSAYVKDKTVIKNKMGSTYTFYCFPASGSDPFGYTAEAYHFVKNHGGMEQDSDSEKKPALIAVTAHVPELRRGDSGRAVRAWQTILDVTPDGDFGPVTQAATIKFQTEHGITADGIVGKDTWGKGLYLRE